MNNDMKADFDARAATFPCMFINNSLLRKERIRAIQLKLENELEADDDPPEETIVKLNFSTWIEFKIGEYENAKEINEKVLSLSERKNITSIICQAHILWHDGDEREAEECLKEAEHLRNGSDGEKIMSKVEAELAYSFSRLGGPDNLARAIDLYGRVIGRHPEVYLWKFGLGLTHRRATHGNLYLTTSPKRTVKEHAKIAAELLFDVTNGSLDNRLKGRAFSQLAVMRSHANILLNRLDCEEIFGYDVDFPMFIDKALECCHNDALTLTECGRILRFTNLERGTSLLEKSIAIKKHSTTYHQLGMCYEKMAKIRAKNNVKMVPRPVEIREKTLDGTRCKNFNKNTTYWQQEYSSLHEVTPCRFPHRKPNEKHSEGLPKQPSRDQKKLTYPNQLSVNDTQAQGRPQKYPAITNTPKRDQLGISYKKQRSGGVFVRSPAKEFHLRKDDDLVVKALDCYREAIQMSREGNIPGVYSLGLLLRTCGEFDLALKQFNKIIHQTTGKTPVTEYCITLTSAYEQAGLCLLYLANRPGKTEEESQKLNADAETKLMAAVSLSATLANLDPEMKRYDKQAWNAFKTLETKYEEIKDSPKEIKKHIELLRRVGQYERIPPVITKLRMLSEDEANDPSVFQSEIESYLKLGRYEDAYSFASSASSTVVCTNPLKALVLKVKLHTAAARLVSQEFTAAQLMLKALFLSCFERPQKETNQEGRENHNPHLPEDAKEILDVLIVYDLNNEDRDSHFWEKVNTLQVILSGEFGLTVDTIDEMPDAGKLELSQHVNEIIAAKVVLVLLRGAPCTWSSLFTRVLEYIPIITMDSQPEPHIVLGLADDGVKVDQMLMRFMQIDIVDLLDRIKFATEEEIPEQLQDLTQDPADTRWLGAPGIHHGEVNDFHTDPVRGPAIRAPPVNISDIRVCPVCPSSGREFDDSVTAKMSLFCALIKTQWPM